METCGYCSAQLDSMWVSRPELPTAMHAFHATRSPAHRRSSGVHPALLSRFLSACSHVSDQLSPPLLFASPPLLLPVCSKLPNLPSSPFSPRLQSSASPPRIVCPTSCSTARPAPARRRRLWPSRGRSMAPRCPTWFWSSTRQMTGESSEGRQRRWGKDGAHRDVLENNLKRLLEEGIIEGVCVLNT